MALATALLAASCSSDGDLADTAARYGSDEITFNVTTGDTIKTRATLLNELEKFKVYAYADDGEAIIDGDEFVKHGEHWYPTKTAHYYWPTEGSVSFYAYAEGSATALEYDASAKTLKYTASTDGAKQADLVYAYATDSKALAQNGEVTLAFKHALSSFSVSARLAGEEADTCSTVTIGGVSLCGIQPSGTIDFAKDTVVTSGDTINSTMPMASEAITLTTEKQMLSSESGYLLIPAQQQNPWNGAGSLSGMYLAVKCKVYDKHAGSYVVGSDDGYGTVYVPMSKALGQAEGNRINLVFGKNTKHLLSYGKDENGVAYTIKEPSKSMTFVDLGLSVKWAQVNIGADYAEESGNYYAWAETDTTKGAERVKPDATGWDYNANNAPYSNGYGWYSRYNVSYNDYKLEKEDDAACVAWGGNSRMATKAEFDELKNNCSSRIVEINGVQCRKYTSRKAGYTDKYILIPLAGQRYGTSLRTGEGWSYFWIAEKTKTSSASTGVNRSNISFGGAVYLSTNTYLQPVRYRGFPVRAVCDK